MPNVQFTPFEPTFLHIGPIAFHYYGLMYVLGFAFMYYLLPRMCRLRGVNISKDIFENIFFISGIGALIGGRLFHVFFYDWAYFSTHLTEIIAVWHGGMASHGGFIGAGIALYFLSRHYKISFWALTDCIVIPTGIGLMLGRFGNFINGELYGTITDVPWCIQFEGVDGCRHPTQLYAMIKDFSLFIIFYSLRNSKFPAGVLTMLFFASYSVFRFIVDIWKEDDAFAPLFDLHFTGGQWMSLVIFPLTLTIIWYFYKNNKNNT